jgi:hypothetical protein
VWTGDPSCISPGRRVGPATLDDLIALAIAPASPMLTGEEIERARQQLAARVQ